MFFNKTGIRQSSRNKVKAYEVVRFAIRRIETLPRNAKTPYNSSGQQINASYILYSEDYEIYKVSDRIEFSLDEIYQNQPFIQTPNMIICEIKEQPINYGFKINGYTGEVFLSTLN